MELEAYVNGLREQLAVAAEAGGEEAVVLAQRLTAPLDSAVRLMLLDALSVAAAEITRELAPGSVDVRLRGGDPEFVVTAPSADPDAMAGHGAVSGPAAGDAGAESEPLTGFAGAGEGGVSRVNLRLPDQLKRRIEQAAEGEGLSINTWLVRAAAAAAQRGGSGAPHEHDAPRGGQRYTGWGR